MSRAEYDDEQRGGQETLLRVDDLQTAFFTDKETIRAVDGVSFEISRGESVGIVGESGSGKSVTARSIMGLVDTPGRIIGGSIEYKGENLVGKSDEQWRQYRGSEIAMVFQDPLSSLNPVYTVGNQIKEALRLHQGLRGKKADEAAIELLEDVGIPDAPRRLKEYPHQFSGGCASARSSPSRSPATRPAHLRRADDGTRRHHPGPDPGAAPRTEGRTRHRHHVHHPRHGRHRGDQRPRERDVRGRDGGVCTRRELFENPKHPYTQGLLESIPSRNERGTDLRTIEGDVPTPNERATYCRFAPRCPKAFDDCEQVHPVQVEVEEESTTTGPRVCSTRMTSPRTRPWRSTGLARTRRVRRCLNDVTLPGETRARREHGDRRDARRGERPADLLRVGGRAVRRQPREGRRRRRLRHPARRDARSRRRVRLWEVHARAHADATRDRDERRGALRRHRHHVAVREEAQGVAPERPDGVPGPGRQPQRPDDGRRDHQGAAERPRLEDSRGPPRPRP